VSTPHPAVALLRRPTTLAGLALAALTGLAACADAPTAPRTALAPGAAPSLEVVSPEVVATGLLRDVPTAQPIVTEFTATSGGGSYRIPGGLRIDVPGGLFKTPQTIRVTTLPGQMVAYEFQPHGLVFRKALRMRQDLRGTNWSRVDRRQFEIGYFADPSAIYATQNKALIKEFLRATVDTRGQHVDFDVFHFSGYMVSTGRSR
jgi:hypothetical protein